MHLQKAYNFQILSKVLGFVNEFLLFEVLEIYDSQNAYFFVAGDKKESPMKQQRWKWTSANMWMSSSSNAFPRLLF